MFVHRHQNASSLLLDSFPNHTTNRCANFNEALPACKLFFSPKFGANFMQCLPSGKAEKLRSQNRRELEMRILPVSLNCRMSNTSSRTSFEDWPVRSCTAWPYPTCTRTPTSPTSTTGASYRPWPGRVWLWRSRRTARSPRLSSFRRRP